MKTIHLTITVIASIITTSVIWYFANYDPTPVTKENNFGISALVIHSLSFGCPMEKCSPPDHFLKISSKLKTSLLGYKICDTNSCIKKDGISISLPILDVLNPDYQKLPLPDNLSWKDGDSVNIQVKVPRTSIIDNTLYFDPSLTPNIWVDLGNSEIVKSS